MPPPPADLAQRDAEDARAIRDLEALDRDCDAARADHDRRLRELPSIDDPGERAYRDAVLLQRAHVIETQRRTRALLYKTARAISDNCQIAARAVTLMARRPRMARATRSTRSTTSRRVASFASASSDSGGGEPGDSDAHHLGAQYVTRQVAA